MTIALANTTKDFARLAEGARTLAADSGLLRGARGQVYCDTQLHRLSNGAHEAHFDPGSTPYRARNTRKPSSSALFVLGFRGAAAGGETDRSKQREVMRIAEPRTRPDPSVTRPDPPASSVVGPGGERLCDYLSFFLGLRMTKGLEEGMVNWVVLCKYKSRPRKTGDVKQTTHRSCEECPHDRFRQLVARGGSRA